MSFVANISQMLTDRLGPLGPMIGLLGVGLVLVVLTLPVTVVTLGLFLFVINAAVFQFAAWMLDGLQVAGFGAALITSLLYSLCGMVIDSALQRLFDED